MTLYREVPDLRNAKSRLEAVFCVFWWCEIRNEGWLELKL